LVVVDDEAIHALKIGNLFGWPQLLVQGWLCLFPEPRKVDPRIQFEKAAEMRGTYKAQFLRYLLGRPGGIMQISFRFQDDPALYQFGGWGMVAEPEYIGECFRRSVHGLCIELYLVLRAEMHFQQQVELPNYIHSFIGKGLITFRMLLGNTCHFNDQ